MKISVSIRVIRAQTSVFNKKKSAIMPLNQ